MLDSADTVNTLNKDGRNTKDANSDNDAKTEQDEESLVDFV